VNGSHGVTITAPGAGNNDVVEVSPNLNSSGDKWLRHDWNNDGDFDDDPSAIATFGIYTGSSVQIYIQ
jgi:MSHA biogenesis protein MshQ